jgi:hypothetical protein
MKSRRLEYKNHWIELREDKDQGEIIINGIPAKYGRFSDGLYFLRDYAYDPSENLEDLAKKFIEHKLRADEQRQKLKPAKSGGD